MNEIQVTFHHGTNVTNPGEDGLSFLFLFNVVPCRAIGQPDEDQQTREHRLIIRVSGSRLPAWNLNIENVAKVLFEIGKRHVIELLEKNRPLDRTVEIPVNTSTHNSDCPFDPTKIPNPEGVTVVIQPRIGFV